MERIIDFEFINPFYFQMTVKEYLDKETVTESDIVGKWHAIEIDNNKYGIGHVETVVRRKENIVATGEFITVYIHGNRLLAKKSNTMQWKYKGMRRHNEVSEEAYRKIEAKLDECKKSFSELFEGVTFSMNRIYETSVKTLFLESELDPYESLNEVYEKLVRPTNGMLKYVGKILWNMNSQEFVYVKSETTSGVEVRTLSGLTDGYAEVNEYGIHGMNGSYVETKGVDASTLLLVRKKVLENIQEMYAAIANASRHYCV